MVALCPVFGLGCYVGTMTEKKRRTVQNVGTDLQSLILGTICELLFVEPDILPTWFYRHREKRASWAPQRVAFDVEILLIISSFMSLISKYFFPGFYTSFSYSLPFFPVEPVLTQKAYIFVGSHFTRTNLP